MKKIYLLALILPVISGCSKDFLKRYEKRIVGIWRLTDVDKRGIGGGSVSHQTFTNGEFIFSENGDLTYTDDAGTVYQGNWDIRREHLRGGCHTDENGNTECDDRSVKSLSIFAIDFVTQHVKTEYFDEMVFTGTNRFKAYIYSGFQTYIFRFRR